MGGGIHRSEIWSGFVVRVGWFKGGSDLGLVRVTGTKECQTCCMCFGGNGGMRENAVRGETFVDEFRVSVSKTASTLNSFVMVGNSMGSW